MAVVHNKVTPEERLLRLIESGEKGQSGGPPLETGSNWKMKFWPKIFSSSSNTPNRGRPFFQVALPGFSLNLVNRMLVVVLIAVIIAIAFQLTNTQTVPADLKTPPDMPTTPRGNKGEGDLPLVSNRPLADYLREVTKRNIFAPMPVVPARKLQNQALKQTTPVKPPPPNPVQVLQEKVKSLKLVGISWGKDPVAMIEDRTSHETSFLKVGDSINGVTVKAILQDRAILGHGDAEYDLF